MKKALLLIAVLFVPVPCVYAQKAVEYLQMGNDDLKQRNLDQAIIDFTKAIDIDPNLAKAYNNRGVAYAQEGSLSRAIADFTMSIANDPKDAQGYNNRGHAYANEGDFVQAIADYTQAIRINAFYVKAYNNRELAYYELKQYDKAWADVHTVQAIGGNVAPDFIKDLKKALGKNQ